MKKVAIVSCYFKDNYGSLLQAYATQKILEKGFEWIQKLPEDNYAKFKKLPTDLKLCALNTISCNPNTYGEEFKKVTSQLTIAEIIENIDGMDVSNGKKTKAKACYWKIFDKLPDQAIYEKNTLITWLCSSIVNYYNQNDEKYMKLVRDLIDCFEGKYDEMVKCCWYDPSRSETISHILSKTMLSEAGKAGLQGIQLSIAESLLKVGFNNDYQKALANRTGAKAMSIISTLHDEKDIRINAIFEILKSYAPNGTLYQQCQEACNKRQHNLVYYLLFNGGVNLTTQDHKDILTLLMEYSKRSSMFGYREKFVLLLESVKCNGFTFEERLSWFTRANDMLPTVGRSDKNKGLLYSSGKHLFDDLRSHTSKSSEQQNDLIKKLKILKPKN